ncbi:MAG: alpha/beta fold hydrolase [Bacteroidota bacterium]
MNDLLYFETHQREENSEWLLLIHGAGGSTRTWKRQIKSLGTHYNLLVVDLPGHGKNKGRDLGEDVYSFEWMAEQLWKIVDSLSIDRIHLVGISLGTILCFQMRILQPNRVLSMVLPGASVRLNLLLKIIARVSIALAKLFGYRNLYQLSAYIMMPKRNHKQSRDIFIQEAKALTRNEFRKWTLLYFSINKTLNGYFQATSSIPHLLVMGSEDHFFLAPAHDYAAVHPNSEIEVIEHCGHVVSIEQAEQFNARCLAFLERIRVGALEQANL